MTAMLFLSILTAFADVTIDADTILLGALVPFPSGDARAAIVMGYAPNPGLARRIGRAEILKKLAMAGQPSEDVALPESILVHRRAAGLDRDQVTSAILDALIQRFPDANVEITGVEIPNLQIGTGEVQVKASLPPRVDPSNPFFARVELRGTSFVKTAFVRTTVRVEAEQTVLKNKVSAHSEIQADDVETKMMPVRGGSVPAPLDGQMAKRDLQPGQVLTAESMYTPVYVKKGDSVTVKATAGAVTIAATMRAKAAGKLGDVIAVEHLSGSGSAMARVIGPKILEVLK